MLLFYLKNKFSLFRPSRLVAILVALVFALQSNLAAQNTSYEDYNNPAKDVGESTAEKIVGRNIERAYKALNGYAKDQGEKIAEFGSQQKDKETRFGNEGPERNPLDKFNGRLDPARSWDEYVMDSRIILKESTFPTCLEPRLIAEKDPSGVHRYDPGNAAYIAACEFYCLPWLDQNYWQLFSYYWPEHQISVNRAGAQMIDPDIIEKENRGAQELYRTKTSTNEKKADKDRNQDKQVKLLKDMGIPADDPEKFTSPDYHDAGKEFHLRQDGELRYPGAMRPNAMWRAADSRVTPSEGYLKNPYCFFNALDPPTSQRKVIANRLDQGVYAILARYPEVRKRVDQERYQYTSPSRSNLSEYKDSTSKQFLQSLCASWRMGSNPDVYGDLKKVGFESINSKKYKDYCLPGGYDLSGSMVQTEGTPLLQADAARAVMAAIWLGKKWDVSSTGSEGGKEEVARLKNMNSTDKRLSQFTFYEKRANSNVPRYVNLESNPGENKSNIVFIDKLQRIYPTQSIGGNADGKIGGSSKGFRTDVGQRGSHCFRPEDIPNWSSEGTTNKSEWPLGLVGSVNDHFGETRWAIWNRRVACTCSEHGPLPLTPACISLNHGDHEESVFIGTKPGVLPQAIEKSFPVLRKLANETSQPKPMGFTINNLADWNALSKDSGVLGSGYSKPKLPQGQQGEYKPQEPADPNEFLLCILAEDRDGNQQNQNNQNNQQNGQNQQGQNNGGTNNGGGAAPPTAGGANCPGGV